MYYLKHAKVANNASDPSNEYVNSTSMSLNNNEMANNANIQKESKRSVCALVMLQKRNDVISNYLQISLKTYIYLREEG